MRRAGQERTVSRETHSPAPPDYPRHAAVASLHAAGASAVDPLPADVLLTAEGTFVGKVESGPTVDRNRQLVAAIRQRIESRLPGRLRNLIVRMVGDHVVLEGQCATYYTKQLAQHAALGILEDEHLENAIVVDLPR